MHHPTAQNLSQMTLGEGNDEIQTLKTNSAHQPFAKCVGLWRANRRSENGETHGRQRAIHTLRINAVAIVDHVPMRLITRNDHAELLPGPFRRWMFRRIPVRNASSRDV